MVYLYILQSENSKRYYIGSTGNVTRRLKEHQSGKVISTKNFLPIKLVFKEYFADINSARRWEKKLKRLKRRDYTEKVVTAGKICSELKICA